MIACKQVISVSRFNLVIHPVRSLVIPALVDYSRIDRHFRRFTEARLRYVKIGTMFRKKKTTWCSERICNEIDKNMLQNYSFCTVTNFREIKFNVRKVSLSFVVSNAVFSLASQPTRHELQRRTGFSRIIVNVGVENASSWGGQRLFGKQLKGHRPCPS